MSEWRSIKTAPKDGSFVDLWHVSQGRFADCRWLRHALPKVDGQPTFAWFKQSGGRAYNMGLDVVFTHWMPLPEPPND